MDSSVASPRDALQFKIILALGLLPALALSFPIIVFFRFQRYWSWAEFHLYAAFFLGIVLSLLLKRRVWSGKFFAISSPVTTYLFFLYFDLGNPFAGVDYMVLLVMYSQIITLVGLGLFLFSSALITYPSSSSSSQVNGYFLSSVLLGSILAAGILYLGYLSWTVAYLLAGLLPGASAAIWFWRHSMSEDARDLSGEGSTLLAKKQHALFFFTALFGTMILAAVPVFLGGTSLGLLVANAANVGYFDRIVDSSPDFLFNYYGLPGTLLVGAGFSAVLLVMRTKWPRIRPALPYIFLLGGCWGYFCLQGFFYFNVLPPIAGNLLLGIPLVLIFCAILQWAHSRWFLKHDLNRAILYLISLLALGFGLILPSDSSAMTNLGDVLYLVIAGIPGVVVLVTFIINTILQKTKERSAK